ncbi:transcriptional regulator [Salinisphaera orenii MK-B5]|uniref:Transcriptional regulator n=1 Tax=Salinisphaera orenii MK-B5 TaxID=856730 RepID=A0A423PEL3_9GAMM|nr:TetR/AcrR family transcriptional regulator [Salinisphaera orenii]ROO24028.1 transcriptional regulator [Salinisphaera orenii MK-B5]
MTADAASEPVPSLRRFAQRHELTTTALCAQIVAGGEHSISVRKPAVAADNLARIVGAMLRLANRSGFAGMTLRELATASGLSLGGLYAYIRSKDELAQIVQRQIGRTLHRVLDDTLAEVAGPRERLAAAVRAHIYVTEALRDWFFFLYMEAHHLAAPRRREAMAMERASETVLADIIRAGQAAGHYRALAPEPAAGLIKAMLQDWYLKRRKHGDRGLDVDAYAAMVIAAAEAHLTAEP